MFYLTNKGVERLATCTLERSKLKIDHVVFGNGGVEIKNIEEVNKDIESVNKEVYRKDIDINDSFERYKKDILKLCVVLTPEVGPFIVNEIGFYSNEELVIYGTTENIEKLSGESDLYYLEIETLIKFKNEDLSHIEIITDYQKQFDERLDYIEQLVKDAEIEEVTEKINEFENNLKNYEEQFNKLDEVSTKFKDYDSRFNDIDKKLESLDGVNDKLDEFNNKYNSLNNSITQINNKYTELENKLNNIDLEPILNRLSDLENEVTGVAKSFDKLIGG